MVYGRYNELVFMGIISWFINQLTGGPHPVPIWVWFLKCPYSIIDIIVYLITPGLY